MANERLKIENRISTLEANYKDLASSLDEVKNNHLLHIQNGLDELKTQVSQLRVDFAKYIGIGIGGIAVLEILIRFVLKV